MFQVDRMATNRKELNRNKEAFYELLRAGLWGREARLASYEGIDYSAVMKIAEEQSVSGVITAGLEQVKDVKIPEEWKLQFIGSTLQTERRNREMNVFIAGLITRMRKAGIYTLLVKGQGIAQCYERPLWRECGDVDLFLGDDNYYKAKELLTPIATQVEPEAEFKKHLGLYIDGWLVELHGSLRNGLSARIDKTLDDIQTETFNEGKVRSTLIGKTQVFMLGLENDIMYVFSHILDHFYKGGIGLRQICDWARLIYVNREKLNLLVLGKWISQMGLASEWRAFGAFAVEWLGMPSETMPFLNANLDNRLKRKAKLINDFVMMSGNMGHNRDLGYLDGKSLIVRKAISLKQRVGDVFRHARIFPLDSFRFFWGITRTGVKAVAKRGC